MRLWNGLFLACLPLIAVLFFYSSQEVGGSMGPTCCWVSFYTSTGGGGFNFNWTASGQTSSQTFQSGTGWLCLYLPHTMNITVFEPRGYPFVRWETPSWAKMGNSTSNHTNITFTDCNTGTIKAVFNGPATSIPTELPLLLVMVTVTSWLRGDMNRRMRKRTHKANETSKPQEKRLG